MPKYFTISNKILSLRGRIEVLDENNHAVYEGVGEFAFFQPTWRLFKGQHHTASIQRKLFSWSPTWLVSGDIGEFKVSRKLFSWKRQYTVTGGNFDKAELSGSFWDFSFKVEYNNQLIASAQNKIFSLRDTHTIEVRAETTDEELFAIIAMMILHLDKRDQQQSQSA